MGAFDAILGSTVGEGTAHYKSGLAWSRTKRMMQKRHQWEVADLKKAGINPIYTAGGTPSMGSPQMGTDQNWGGAAGTERETKRKGKQDRAVRDQMRVQMRLGESQILTQVSQADLNAANAASVRAQTQRYKPISDIGSIFGTVTGAAKAGDIYTGVKTIMGGNADEAAKSMKRFKAWMAKKAEESKAEAKRRGYHDGQWR